MACAGLGTDDAALPVDPWSFGAREEEEYSWGRSLGARIGLRLVYTRGTPRARQEAATHVRRRGVLAWLKGDGSGRWLGAEATRPGVQL